jgi:hypothetical protein
VLRCRAPAWEIHRSLGITQKCAWHERGINGTYVSVEQYLFGYLDEQAFRFNKIGRI